MPTKTKPTQAEMIGILAAKVMGWRVVHKTGGTFAYRKGKPPVVLGKMDCSLESWDPPNDLNVIHDLEERLTEEQWEKYLHELMGHNQLHLYRPLWKFFRHAPADICAEAICRVIAPERFK